ncbi:putative protein kinase RLK-Pelle-LRR-XII-1 family [Medicago truncatula]|uniref:non-specific serine/threonine protein kinase n=1 Tax=Medicago truncatula TaxID=3880 RepID=A0A396HX27_MEDTR|nr:putative protein kinase RLK-Pelle-LRR-XII-1 family [Medicago truncatula]
MAECNALGKMKHQNLVKVLTCCSSVDYKGEDFKAIQAVVHCDLKPSNVLLDDDFVAHLGDFGLARIILGTTEHSSKDQVISSTIKGTIGYIPPEYGEGVPVSPKGDIYSFGILLLEMFTGKRPTNNNFSERLSLHKFCKIKIPEAILEIVDSQLLFPFAEDEMGIVENKIRNCLVMFAAIGVACSKEVTTHRMLIKDVIVKLNQIKSKFPC